MAERNVKGDSTYTLYVVLGFLIFAAIIVFFIGGIDKAIAKAYALIGVFGGALKQGG